MVKKDGKDHVYILDRWVTKATGEVLRRKPVHSILSLENSLERTSVKTYQKRDFYPRGRNSSFEQPSGNINFRIKNASALLIALLNENGYVSLINWVVMGKEIASQPQWNPELTNSPLEIFYIEAKPVVDLIIPPGKQNWGFIRS